MELSSEQKMALERLYENESLTDNLADADAKALLQWAQKQILDNTDSELVATAVRAANESGEMGVQAVIAQAASVLTQELTARQMNTAPKTTTPGILSADANAGRDSAAESESFPMSASTAIAPDAPRDQTTQAKTEQPLPSAQGDAKIGARKTNAAVRKGKRRKSTRGKKK